MNVVVRLTNHRIPPYVLTDADDDLAGALVQEWQWGTARVLMVPLLDKSVYVARREVLAVEVDEPATAAQPAGRPAPPIAGS